MVNGGAHAQNTLEFQEFMLAPIGGSQFRRSASGRRRGLPGPAWAFALRRALTGLGDEGGFAPNLATPEEVLDLLVEAITAAGYTPGGDGIAIALDPPPLR